MLKRLENGSIDWDFLIKALELKDPREINKKIFGKIKIQGVGYFLRYLRVLKNLKDKEKVDFYEERIDNIKKRIDNVEKYMFNKISYEEYKKNDRNLVEKSREYIDEIEEL